MSYSLGTASGRIDIDGSGGAAGFRAVEVAADAMFAVVRKKVDDIESLGRKMRNTGAAGVAGFGVAIAAASGFEKQMSGVQSVTNSVGKEFDDLKAKAMQLGADTAFSASEAALAIEELAKAGISVTDILNGAADGAVALAAAGGIGLPEAATIASNAMNQFGIAGSEVTKVADILAGAANTSAADVSTLGSSLGQVGAVADLAGLSLKDTVIALGELADAGIQGSDAGTSVKTMLNNLIPSTDAQADEFRRLNLLTYDLADANTFLRKEGLKQQTTMDGVRKVLGKYAESMNMGTEGTVKNAKAVEKMLALNGVQKNAFFDESGRIKTLGKLQGVLYKATKDMTEQQRLQSLELLFGADAMRASAILSKAGAKGYHDFARAMKETTAADAAKVRLNNLSGAVEAMKGSFELVLITIGSVFLPMVTKVVNFVTKLINIFNNFPEPVKKAIAIIGGIVSILLVMVGVVLSSITVIAGMIAQFLLMAVIKTVTLWVKSYIVAMRTGATVSAAFTAANAAAGAQVRRTTLIMKIGTKVAILFGKAMLVAGRLMKFAMSPVGLIIIAIIVALVVLYKRSEKFRAIVDKLAKSIKDGLTKAWQFLLPYLKEAWVQIQALGKIIGDYLVSTFQKMLPYIKEAWNNFLELAKVVGGALMDAWDALGPALIEVFKALAKFGNYVGKELWPVIMKVGAALGRDLVKNLKGLRSVFRQDLLPALQDFVKVIQTDAVPAAKSLWKSAEPVIKTLAKWAAIITVVLYKALVVLVKFIVSKLLPPLIRIIGFILGIAIPAFAEFAAGIIKAVGGVVKIITGFIRLFKALFNGDWSAVWAAAKEIAAGAFQLIKGLLRSLLAVGIAIMKRFGAQIVAYFKKTISDLFGEGGKLNILTKIFGTAFKIISTTVRVAFKIISTYAKVWFKIFTTIFRVAFKVISTIIKIWSKTVLPIWKTIFKVVFAFLKVWFKVAIAYFKTVFKIISGIIRIGFAIFKTFVLPIIKLWFAAVKLYFNLFKTIIVAVFNFLKPYVIAIWNFIKDNVIKGVVAMWNQAKVAFNGIRNVTVTVFNFLKKFIAGAVLFYKTKIIPAWELIKARTKAAWAAFKTNIVTPITNTYNTVKGKIQSFVDTIKRGWERVKSGTKSAFDKFENTIDTAINNVLDFINTFPANLKARFYGALNWLKQTGKDLIQGMINGVQEMAKKLGDAAVDVVRGAKNKITGFLKIGSPSKLFHQYGVWTIMGMVNGIKSQKKSAEGAALAMAKGISSNLALDTKGFHSTLGNYGKALQKVGGSKLSYSASMNTNKLNGQVATALTGASVAMPKPKKKKQEKKALRIEGDLGFTPDGRAYIEGVAWDVVDEADDFNNTGGRRG